MYTRIENGNLVKDKDIIGIFDVKTLSESRENKRILHQMKKKKENGQSIILLDKEDEDEQYFISNIAITTLKKRFEKVL